MPLSIYQHLTDDSLWLLAKSDPAYHTAHRGRKLCVSFRAFLFRERMGPIGKGKSH